MTFVAHSRRDRGGHCIGLCACDSNLTRCRYPAARGNAGHAGARRPKCGRHPVSSATSRAPARQPAASRRIASCAASPARKPPSTHRRCAEKARTRPLRQVRPLGRFDRDARFARLRRHHRQGRHDRHQLARRGRTQDRRRHLQAAKHRHQDKRSPTPSKPKVLRIDQIADLAIIKVSSIPSDAKVIALGDPAKLSIGADVHAIGHPLGEVWSYTKGIVSQIRHNYEWTYQ